MSAPDLAEARIMRPFRYPKVVCDLQAIQLSCYNVCHHVCSGTAVSHQSPATPGAPGFVLCHKCAEYEMAEKGDVSKWMSFANPRLVCPQCAHQAGLISSPKVNL